MSQSANAGVLRQQRAVHVGADDGAVRPAADALGAVGAVVAVALEHAPERRGARRRGRSGRRGSRSRRAAPGPPGRSSAIAMLPSSRGPSSRRVSRSTSPTPGQPLVAQLVAVAEQLQPAADGEHDRAALGGGVQRVALDRREVARAQRLVAVLAAADVEEVVRVGVDLVADPGARELEADPAPRAAPLEHGQVAAVGVDVHQVGIERAARAASGSATQQHHLGADVLASSARSRAPARARGRRRGPRPRAARRVRCASSITSSSSVDAAVRARTCAGRARSASPRAARAPRSAARRSASRRRAATSGIGQLPSSSPKSSSAVGDRDGEQPAGEQVAPRPRRGTRRARAAAGSSASARGSARSGARARSRARRPTTRRDRSPSAAARAASAASSSGSRSSAVTSCPARARSSATRPVPAPTSSTGPGSARGQLAPQRQVGVVAAALDVVPHDQRREAHRQCPCTWPRRASRSRSSSSAV